MINKKRVKKQSKNELVVFIFNCTEDEWSFIKDVSDKKTKRKYIEACENVTDCFFLMMATEKNFCYISPKPISIKYQKYAKNILHYQKTEILVPKLKSHLICEDLMNDNKIYRTLLSDQSAIVKY